MMNDMNLSSENRSPRKKIGVLVGGSGLIGGTLMHYFKTRLVDEVEIYAPNSKKMSLREPDDIQQYFARFRPDFIINASIAAIDSDPRLAYETNYLGSINLARKALELKIPYIHFSSAAALPAGENIREDEQLALSPDLSNYAKSKLMAELTLAHLHKTQGLDYTAIRLAVVYGKHDHKVQGFHRLLFSVANQAMPVMLTKKGVKHSYTNAAKLPYFVHHLLENRGEFSGQVYNFVDPTPVELALLILTIKSYLELKVPKEIYLPYPLAHLGKSSVQFLIQALNRIGIEARMPAELMFMQQFYHNQSLSSAKLAQSSFTDPKPQTTIFTELPDLIEYYLTRWEQLNLIRFNPDFFDPRKRAEEFLNSPQALLDAIHQGLVDPCATSIDPCARQAGLEPKQSR
ncbi:MAG: epimerase [Deltaproteobacteria bacterium RIFOXYD12_FULL_50_9]|nr:MAG: epimerase [Deltaproteobacteria bacterium RIFOXYD12_FULL_50_9]